MPAAPVPATTQQSDGGGTSTRTPTPTTATRTATVRIDGESVTVSLTEDDTVTSVFQVADVGVTRASIDGGEGWLEGPVDAPFVSGTARFEVAAGEVTGRVQLAADVDVLGSLVARIGYDGPAGAALPMPAVEVDGGRVNVDLAGRLADGQLVVEPVTADLPVASQGRAAPASSDGDGEGGVAAPPRDASPGNPLPPALTEKLTMLLGEPPAGLLLHTDAAAADAVRASDASGLVVGADLYAPPESADPEVPSGLDLLVRMVTQALAGIDGPALPAADLTDPTTEQAAPQPPVAFEPPGPMGVPAPEVAPEGAAPGTSPEQAAASSADATAPSPADAAAEAEAVAAEGDAGAVAEAPGGEDAVEPPGVELLIPPAPAEPPPEQQERIRGVSRRAGGRARSARDLPPADELTTDAREGVTEPPAETMARAEAAVAEVLGEREPPSPAIVDLCDEIRTAIREKRPVDEDDLVTAEPEEMAEEAGRSLNTAVEGEADQVDTSYDAIDQVEAGEPAQTGEPVPDQSPHVGGSEIDATAAAPDAIPPEDLSLDADREQLDAQVEASNINRPSTEPITDEPFASVREGQEQFNELAETAPAEVIAEQDAALEQASADMAALQLQAMQTLQLSRAGAVDEVGDRQQGMVVDETATRESLSRQATDIFTTAQTQVNALLDPLTRTAMEKWNRGVDRASTTFKNTLSRVERWIEERHEGVGGFFVSGWDAAFGLPDWVTDSYDRAERLFGDDVCDLLLEISSDVSTVITAAEELIADARRRIDDLFTQDLPAELQEWAAQQRAEFNQRLDGLHAEVSEAQQDFEQQISEAAVSSVREVQQEVEALRQAARGLLGQVMDAIGDFLDDPVRAIINGLLSLVGIPPPAFWALVDKVAQVASDIADDPMNFVNNLMSAIGQGFQLFFDHIGDHLLQGLFDWLFAGLGSVGVQIPAGTSVGELVTFALQLMGITWPNIREILVRHIGEENVELIEQAWELVSVLIEQGPEGIIEMLRERLAPEAIFQMVLDAAIDYVVETLVEQAARWLLSLLSPAGWVTKAIELIYQVLRWVFENAARIFRFVETIVDGLADIVAGNIGGMAAAVERALASLIPVVIDFLAGLVGLGDLPDQVVEVIKAIQTRVLAVLDTIIGWLVGRARALLEALGLGGEEDEDGTDGGDEDTELGSTERFTAAGESHRQWVELIGTTATLMIASTPETLEQRLDRWDREVDELPEASRPEAAALLPQARSLHEQADATADDLAPAFAEAESAPAPAEGEAAGDVPSDAPLESKQEQLSRLLRRLFELFGETADPEAIIADIGARLPGHGHTFTAYVIRRWLDDQVEKVTITATSSRRVWTDAVFAGTDREGATLLNQRPTHESLLEYFTEAPGERSADTETFAHHVFRARSPVPPHQVHDQYRTSIGDAAATELRSKGTREVTPDVNADLHDIISQIAYAIDLPPYGRFSPFPSIDGVHPHLRAAVLESGGVIDFMVGMVISGRVGELTWTDFANVWSNGGRNVEWLKAQFRGVNLGSHEWIPTDMFRQVLGFAVGVAQPDRARLDDALKWIIVYNELRSPTNHVIFRIIDEGGELAPTAHVGTFYEERIPGEFVQRGTAPSKDFHDELRAYWTAHRGEGPAAFVAGLRDHIQQQQLVWSGDLSTVPEELHDEPIGFHYRVGESEYEMLTVAQLAARQQANFEAMITMFNSVLAKL